MSEEKYLMVYLEKLVNKSPLAHLSPALHTPGLVSHGGSPKARGPVLLKAAGPGQPYLQRRLFTPRRQTDFCLTLNL